MASCAPQIVNTRTARNLSRVRIAAQNQRALDGSGPLHTDMKEREPLITRRPIGYVRLIGVGHHLWVGELSIGTMGSFRPELTQVPTSSNPTWEKRVLC